MIRRRIGVNYDACHFALEYDDARKSLEALTAAGIRISKIHLSSALALDPGDPAALDAIRSFNEPVYFHQALLRDAEGEITRMIDLPEFFQAVENGSISPAISRKCVSISTSRWTRSPPRRCARLVIRHKKFSPGGRRIPMPASITKSRPTPGRCSRENCNAQWKSKSRENISGC
ncbi:MAG: hypothetical protein HC845_01975 [Akkermansiaceae bacterium]|nr:hypothetical protein [Akkermansiaceae bacterium]